MTHHCNIKEVKKSEMLNSLNSLTVELRSNTIKELVEIHQNEDFLQTLKDIHNKNTCIDTFKKISNTFLNNNQDKAVFNLHPLNKDKKMKSVF